MDGINLDKTQESLAAICTLDTGMAAAAEKLGSPFTDWIRHVVQSSEAPHPA